MLIKTVTMLELWIATVFINIHHNSNIVTVLINIHHNSSIATVLINIHHNSNIVKELWCMLIKTVAMLEL
jgi:hypothetical protein